MVAVTLIPERTSATEGKMNPEPAAAAGKAPKAADAAVPAHIPPELVRSLDLQDGPEMRQYPHAAYARLHDGPRIIYNTGLPRPPFGAGCWIPTRAEDLRAVLQNPAVFSSSKIANFSGLMGESWDLIPAEIDPPAHRTYRRFLDPLFSPAAMTALEEKVRSHAVRLIERVRPDGACDFVSAFSEPFPILIFFSLMGIDESHFENTLKWADELHHGADMAARSEGAVAIGKLLRGYIGERLKNPQNDVISHIVHAKIEGRALTEDEMIGIIYLLFGGGVDTVTGSLGFHFMHLARNPELQSRLRREPDSIPAAVNELLRSYSVVNSYRRVVADTSSVAGVTMKAGDWVMVSLPTVNLDPQEFEDPTAVNLSRKVNRHMAFSYGTHFCLGMHLAQRELKIAYEEWLRRVPTFRLTAEPEILAGTLLAVRSLSITWS
jgi:cytochrome P450